MNLIEIAIYRQRASNENALAKAAVSSEAAAIHEWLAQTYERLADKCQAEIGASDVPLAFPSVQSKGKSQAGIMPQYAPLPFATRNAKRT